MGGTGLLPQAGAYGYTGGVPQLSSGPSTLARNTAGIGMGLTGLGIGSLFLPGGAPISLTIFETTGVSVFGLTVLDAINTSNSGEAGTAVLAVVGGSIAGDIALAFTGLSEVAVESAQYLRSTSGQFMSPGQATLSAVVQSGADEAASDSINHK